MTVDSGKLKAQFTYLRQLRRLGIVNLKKEHDKVFQNTRWKADAKLFTKEWLVKRLFFYFCAKNYHTTGRSLELFRQRAKQILEYIPQAKEKSEEKKLIELRDTGYLSKENIAKLPISEIDGYLTIIGLYAKVSENTRRRLLTEYLYDPSANQLRKTGNVKIRNKFVLTDLIAKFPNMSYDQFRERFGEVMPTTSRRSFTETRSLLKKNGFPIGKLRPGPQRPVIKGKTKHSYAN